MALERLAGTPSHLCEGEAESTRREKKSRVPTETRSREHPTQEETESPAQDRKTFIRDHLVNLVLLSLIPVVRTGFNK